MATKRSVCMCFAVIFISSVLVSYGKAFTDPLDEPWPLLLCSGRRCSHLEHRTSLTVVAESPICSEPTSQKKTQKTTNKIPTHFTKIVERERGREMQSPCWKEVTEVCLRGCCPSPLQKLSAHHHRTMSNSGSTSAACRCDFAATTSSSIFPNTVFTNHESLLSLHESFADFTNIYPKYHETEEVDRIRAKEYYHLSQSNHSCLDYIGISLFSSSQLQNHESSSQVWSDFPFFSLLYKTGSLKTQLLHGGQESKPFKTSRKLLMVYDYESEVVEWMINSSEKRGFNEGKEGVSPYFVRSGYLQSSRPSESSS